MALAQKTHGSTGYERVKQVKEPCSIIVYSKYSHILDDVTNCI